MITLSRAQNPEEVPPLGASFHPQAPFSFPGILAQSRCAGPGESLPASLEALRIEARWPELQQAPAGGVGGQNLLLLGIRAKGPPPPHARASPLLAPAAPTPFEAAGLCAPALPLPLRWLLSGMDTSTLAQFHVGSETRWLHGNFWCDSKKKGTFFKCTFLAYLPAGLGKRELPRA